MRFDKWTIYNIVGYVEGSGLVFYDLSHGESLQIFWCVYKITQLLTYKIINEIYGHVILKYSPLTHKKFYYIYPPSHMKWVKVYKSFGVYIK